MTGNENGVRCPNCDSDFPRYHPDANGYIDCVNGCGHQAATVAAILATARGRLRAVNANQQLERQAKLEAAAERHRRRLATGLPAA